jgi:hypothetical protein
MQFFPVSLLVAVLLHASSKLTAVAIFLLMESIGDKYFVFREPLL